MRSSSGERVDGVLMKSRKCCTVPVLGDPKQPFSERAVAASDLGKRVGSAEDQSTPNQSIQGVVVVVRNQVNLPQEGS